MRNIQINTTKEIKRTNFLLQILPPALPIPGPISEGTTPVVIGLGIRRSSHDLDLQNPVGEIAVVEGESEIAVVQGGAVVGIHDGAVVEQIGIRIPHHRIEPVGLEDEWGRKMALKP